MEQDAVRFENVSVLKDAKRKARKGGEEGKERTPFALQVCPCLKDTKEVRMGGKEGKEGRCGR
jgi:hypothetical protein